MGATTRGTGSGTPRNVVVRSISRTSTSTSWRMASRSRARRLRRLDVSVSEAPAPKFQTSRDSRWRAKRRISGSVTKLFAMVGKLTASARTEARAAIGAGTSLAPSRDDREVDRTASGPRRESRHGYHPSRHPDPAADRGVADVAVQLRLGIL